MNDFRKTEALLVTKNSPAWNDVLFVTKAMSKDETRYMMQGINIERVGNNTLLVATDGRRVHTALLNRSDIEPGFYNVETNKRNYMVLTPAAPDITFPLWRRTIDAGKLQKKTSLDRQDLSHFLHSIYKTTGNVFNIDYIKDLVNGRWEIFFQEETAKATVFINNNKMAVIMPMQETDAVVVDIPSGPDMQDITPVKRLINTDKAKMAA